MRTAMIKRPRCGSMEVTNEKPEYSFNIKVVMT